MWLVGTTAIPLCCLSRVFSGLDTYTHTHTPTQTHCCPHAHVCRPLFVHVQVSDEQMNKILGYVETGKKEGATLETGGKRWGDKG